MNLHRIHTLLVLAYGAGFTLGTTIRYSMASMSQDMLAQLTIKES